jgi:hypothetical protein
MKFFIVGFILKIIHSVEASPMRETRGAAAFLAMLRCTKSLAPPAASFYLASVRSAYGRCLLGRFLPKLGGAFGHRLSFCLLAER